MTMFAVKSKMLRHFDMWLKKRLPHTREVELNQKRIFILPSSIGWLFVVLMILLFITSVNYQNNLLFSLTCLFVSLFVTSILATYQNLSGLVIRAVPSENVFSGGSAHLKVQLDSSRSNTKYALYTGFKDGQKSVVACVSNKKSLSIDFKTSTRGYLHAPRISLYSVYPMGLFRCWTWVSLDFSVWVYPKARQCEFNSSDYSLNSDGMKNNALINKSTIKGDDDFEGLNIYRQGESLKRIAWRHYAKTNTLLSKEFSSQKLAGEFLDWYALDGLGVEQRLEFLCGWVVEFNARKQAFGLRLPNQVIDKDTGASHKRNCLLALAQYGADVVTVKEAADRG